MLTARRSCRPLTAVSSFRERLSHPTTSFTPRAFTNTFAIGPSFLFRWSWHQHTQIAWLSNTSTPDQYVLDRRIPALHPTPTSRRRSRRNADGSITETPKPRSEASTEELERELAWTTQNYPSIPRIKEIVSILIEDRHCRPSALHYEALILGNCDPEHGSVANVQSVLEEMNNEEIAVGATTYNAILKVLSVHTDRDLREQILDEMSHQWIRMTLEARHDIIASLIREGELEKAQDEIARLQKHGFFIGPWLNVLLVHALCEKKDFEAILRVAYTVYDNKGDLPRPTWAYLLRQASAHGDYHLVEWLWQQHVDLMYIEPDRQTCINALRLSALEGKHKLAESIFGVIEALYPDVAQQQDDLLNSTYKKVGINRDAALHQRPSMFAVFSRASGHRKAFFDPKLALRKRPRSKLTNTRRVEKSAAFKEKLKRLDKLRTRSRRSPRATN